jgi:Rps23 Pro-64 3,4-dihydroxylase Tpa1-like proline 4-hydroxylase
MSLLLEPTEIAIRRLERIGDELRSQGQLDAAREAFEKLLSLAPHHLKAERIVSSLSNRPAELPSTRGGLKPAPFVLATNFLPWAMRDTIFEFLMSTAESFEAAQTNEGLRSEIRRSLFRANCLDGLDPLLRNEFQNLLTAQFMTAFRQLLIPAFTPTFIEIHGSIYSNGDFFRAHNDTGAKNTRRITFTFNLHERPKRFEGGDLLLYDTYFRQNSMIVGEPLFARTYTRLAPEDNRLIFFPSEFFHEVVSVVGGDKLRHARYSITGWFHTTTEDGDIDKIAQTPY